MKNKLYIMIGVPGSGKTTFAKTLKNTTYISRDEIRFSVLEKTDSYFDKESKVFNIFSKTIQKALDNEENVVADATHLNSRSRMKLLASLDIDKTKTEVIAVVLKTPLKECLTRNEGREGLKKVPEESILSMYKSFRIPSFYECNGIFYKIFIVEPTTIKELRREDYK